MSVEEIFLDSAENEKAAEALPSYSLETLTLLVNKERVDQLETRLRTQFKELKGRQEEIKALQSFLRALNTATDSKGVLDFTGSPELQDLYKTLDKRFDLTLPSGKTKFVGAERERLVENIKMSLDEKNLENDLLMHTTQQLNNERNESFQMANKIIKTLHDAKMRQTQALSGR